MTATSGLDVLELVEDLVAGLRRPSAGRRWAAARALDVADEARLAGLALLAEQIAGVARTARTATELRANLARVVDAWHPQPSAATFTVDRMTAGPTQEDPNA